MIVRMSAYVIVGVGLAFSAGSSFGESHPSPETLKLFDSDALGYPGLADQGVQQAVNILAANPSATATSDFPPLVPATVQVKLEYWKQYVEQGKQELQDAQASGVSETILA